MERAENLAKGESRGQPENKRVQYEGEHPKAEPCEYPEILPDHKVAQIAKTIGVDFPDK